MMTRALDVNDNSEQTPKRPPQPETGDDLKKKKVEGIALQVNENSVDNTGSVEKPSKSDGQS
jgi:hypothetical protein